MYTVSKGPSKIVAKTRRGLAQNYEKFETIKESSKRSSDLGSPEKNNIPRPVFQAVKKSLPAKLIEEEKITPQHEEIIRYINDSWNIVVAHNPYDSACKTNNNPKSTQPDSNNNNCVAAPSTSAASSYPANSIYCVEPPSPILSDFTPFDLESWWGRRLFNNITKSL